MDTLSQIEEKVYQLSLAEQIQLMERLIHRFRHSFTEQDDEQNDLEKQLAAMANDPQIRRELQMIDEKSQLRRWMV